MGLSGPSCRCVIFSSSVQFSRLPPRIARSFINNSRTPDSSLQRKEKTAKIKSFSCRLLIYLPVLPSLIPVFFFIFSIPYCLFHFWDFIQQFLDSCCFSHVRHVRYCFPERCKNDEKSRVSAIIILVLFFWLLDPNRYVLDWRMFVGFFIFDWK